MIWLRIIGCLFMLFGIVDAAFDFFAHITLVKLSGFAYFIGLAGILLAEIGRDSGEQEEP